MLLQRSKLNAKKIERPRLISPWSILVLSQLLILVLILIYPFKTLVERVINVPWGDQLTTSYLRNLLRTDPNNISLRLVLVRQQISAKQFNSARLNLKPIFGVASLEARLDGYWMDWTISETEMREAPEGSIEKKELLKTLKSKLHQMFYEEADDDFHIEVARKALAYDEKALAGKIFESLANSGNPRKIILYEDAAKLSLLEGNYMAAAKLYLKAKDSTANFKEKKRYFVLAMRTLQRGDMNSDALMLADTELKELRNDDEILTLLIELARAAGKPDIAEKYVRILLRLSLLRQWLQVVASSGVYFSVDGRFIKAAYEGAEVAEKAGPGLPFDDKVYKLGYDVFLGNRNLEDAYRVAAAAVKQAPNNMAWRKRLAQVAEWTQRPRIALENWTAIAKQENNKEAWDSVLRLAPGLFDDEAYLLALKHRLQQSTIDANTIKQIVAIYERLGKPEEGLAYLEEINRQHSTVPIVESIASLAQRMGKDDMAIDTLYKLIEKDGLNLNRVKLLTSLLLIQGRNEEAFKLLSAIEKDISKADTDFWRLYASLADRLQDNAASDRAYRQLVARQDATESDYQMLINGLRDDYPLEAADIAERAWQKFSKSDFLLTSLNLYASQYRWQEMSRLFKSLDAKQRAAFQESTEFFRLRAQHYQGIGKIKLAIQDLKRALSLQPKSVFLQQTFIWALIDTNDNVQLRQLLAKNEINWRHDIQMHDVLGNAHLALSEPKIALEYFLPQVKSHERDFFWLMNFSDALEQNGEADRAWRLREWLWKDRAWRYKHNDGSIAPQELAAAKRIARSRLQMAQRPGDASFSVLRELLRDDIRDAEGKLSPPAREIILAWWQNLGEYDAERAFLWQQYARNMAKPLWAEITIALAQQDPATTGELLEKNLDRLPRYDKVNAARLVNDYPLAATEAYESQLTQYDDQETQQQLDEVLLDQAHSAEVKFANRKSGSLKETPLTLESNFRIWPRIRMGLEYQNISRDSRDQEVMTYVPDEKAGTIKLRLKQNDGVTNVSVGHHRSFDSFNSIELEQQQQIDRRLSLALKLSHHINAPESTLTKIAGMRDQFGMRLEYQLSRYDRFSGQMTKYRYFTQSGLGLGQATEKNLEYIHNIRTELRDLQISLFWSNYGFKAPHNLFVNDSLRRYGVLLPLSAQTALTNAILTPEEILSLDSALLGLLPSSSRIYGLRLSTNVRLQTDYTRKLRPFGSIGLMNNSITGFGYDIMFGVVGSVFGADHFAITQQMQKGGGINADRTDETSISYQLFF